MKTRYFFDDNNELVTLDEVKADYEALKETSDLSDYDNFNDYLIACMAYNNGTLTEVSYNETRMIDVHMYCNEENYMTYDYHEYVYVVRKMPASVNIDYNTVSQVWFDEAENTIKKAM